MLSARSLAVVPEVLCYHRVGRAGQTMATVDARLFQLFAHHDTIHGWLAGRRLLEVYETSLLGWVISQMEWIARRTPRPLQRTLFDILVPIFAQYSPETVAAALREGGKGATARRLSASVKKREYGSFVRTLASRPGSNNPLVTAAFHLKHSGVQHTATLTGRYLRNALQGGKVTRVVSRAARVGRHEPSRQRPDVRPDGDPAAARRAGGPASSEIDDRLGEIERQRPEPVPAPLRTQVPANR